MKNLNLKLIKTTTIVHDSRTWSNSIYNPYLIFLIILIFTKIISFACAFAVFLLFSEHIWMAASDHHSNRSIILDIFQKKTTLQGLFVPHGYKASVNLRQLVIIKALHNDRYSRWNMSNHILSKGEKKNKKTDQY